VGVEVDPRDEKDGESSVDDVKEFSRTVPGSQDHESCDALNSDDPTQDEKAGPEPSRHRGFPEVEVSPPDAEQDRIQE